MSENITSITENLPPRFRDDVVGYAESVRRALPEIFRDSGVRYDEKIADNLLFIAAIRKTHSVITSQYWVFENSLRVMEGGGVSGVRIGSESFYRESEYLVSLRNAVDEFEAIMENYDLLKFVEIRSYSEILKVISNEI